MEALRHVRLTPRGAAEGTFAGPHKSHYRGTAVEFAGAAYRGQWIREHDP